MKHFGLWSQAAATVVNLVNVNSRCDDGEIDGAQVRDEECNVNVEGARLWSRGPASYFTLFHHLSLLFSVHLLSPRSQISRSRATMTLKADASGDLIEHHDMLEVNGFRYWVEPVECVSR